MNEEKKKYLGLRVVSILLKIILVIMFFIAVLKQDWLWSIFAVIMIFIALAPTFFRIFMKIEIIWLFDIFISLALIFHMGNGLLDICRYVPLYNKFTHFFSAVVVAFIFLILLFILNEYYRGVAVNKVKILFDVVVITMAFGVVWEFMEWTSDYLFGWNTQPSLNDTMGDLFADAMGGLFIAFIGYFLITRGVLKRFSENFRKQFDDLIDDD